MKLRRLLLLAAASCALTLSSRAQAPAASDADRDYAAFQASRKVPYPPEYRDMSKAERARWTDAVQVRLIRDGLAFCEKHPADPRRWDVVLYLGTLTAKFIKDIGPDFDTAGAKAVTIDEAAKAAWDARLASLRQAMRTATDVPLAPREELAWTEFAKDFRAATAAMKAGQAVDWAAFRPRFDAHVKQFGELDATMLKRANDYLGALAKNVPAAAPVEWAHVRDTSPSEALRQHAAGQAQLATVMGRPLDLAFTAVDGRKVDLAQLRGKVVLIDFWATWCGPCKEELPNVKKVYADYHARGFEVIGIALDREADRQKLIDFTAHENMPWPQHFDGKYWKNEIAVRFDIKAIPAMFLLDRDGRVVSTNARGPKLEAEVKRLLARAP